MKYHYEKHHKILSVECPPKDYQPENTLAYRWVFDDIKDQRNFISQYEKKPPRFNAKSDFKRCEAMSLSMYKDLESAIGSFYFFKEEQQMNEKVFRILGTKIAKAALEESDGVNETSKDGATITKGHFNHHPAEKHNYSEKFRIIASFIK